MGIKGKVKRRIAISVFLLMVLSSFSAFAENGSSLPVSSVKQELKTESVNKIEDNFIDSISQGDYAEAIVYMKSQVDSMEVAKEAESKLSSALTPYKTKIEVRKAVINALKDNAEDTQQKLLKYLAQEEEKGNVAEYKPYYIINGVYVKATKDVIENISYMSEVEKIYENKLIQLDEPEITSGEIQANEDGVEWNIEKINADAAWDLGVDGTGVVVGTIDTGATWNHPALQAKWRGYNADGTTNPDGNWFDPINGTTMPVDEPTIPHGTHVLGTILGQEPDGSNKVGAAPGAKWITAKAFTPDGGYDDDILAAAQWMLAPGGDATKTPDIINNSWGGGPGLDEWFRPMVQSWRAAGILPVFSAGNQGQGEPPAPPSSVSAPANYPESFAVGAIDINNQRPDFSRRGPGPYDNLKPEVSAPGVNIRSSVPGGYESGWSGTSMSAPAVTGTAALILSANNSLSIEDVENLLKDTAVPLEDADDSGHPNNGYGYGLIDAFEAVSRVASGTGIIEGKVLKEGEDLENPVIVHEQEVFDAYVGSDIDISAQISDDVSITDVELLVKVTGRSYWITLPMTRTSGDYKSGEYTGTITADIIEQPGFSYKIKVRDYDGNVVATDEYNVEVKFGVVPDEYITDFETYPSGWILDGDWQWGEPAEGIGPTPLSGTKLIGTNLSGNYANNGDNYLISVPLDLRNPELNLAQFRINQWYDMENNSDKGFVYVTNDYGETWTQAGPTYTGTQTEWKEIVINLNEYIGSPNPVFIAFRLTTDGSVQKAGWYLDDARLIATDEVAPSAPANLTGRFILNTVTLNWDAAPDNDIAGYKVYRSDLIDGEYIALGETSGTSYGDRDILPETTYYYKVSSYDYAGNESELSLPLTIEVPALGDYTFLTDFEADNGGFTTGGDNNGWEWGIPTSGPGAGFYGEKVWATNLAGAYLNYSNSWIESPEINLPADENSVLTVGQWYEFENNYDKAYIQISQKNGEEWSEWANLLPGTGYITGSGTTWTDFELPLPSSYAGQTVKIRFLLTTDVSVVKAGWYIDYVMIDSSDEPATEVKPAERKKLGLDVDLTAPKKEIEEKPFDLNLETKQSVNNVKYETINDNEVQSIPSVTTGLPVDAVVTVLETGRSARTNPVDGKFKLKHAVNEGDDTWTLRAEAYGFYPAEAQVHLEEDQTVKNNFVLEEMPKGTIVGRVFDRYSHDPAPFATIRVKEDPNVPVVTADENGEFTIPNVYVGDYTLKVIADGFEPGEVSVTVAGNETTEIEVPLKRFVGYEEEIVYDDGTAENALVLNAAGNGLAIRVTPSQYGKVKGANIFFWGTDWPSPGGNQIGVTLYDTDENGNPVKLDIQPKMVDIVRGEWNYIDLSEFGFSTDRDFFVATYQAVIGTSSPGTGIDEASPYADRSYLYVGDTFSPLADEDIAGGLMIRARMEYSVDTPEITNLEDVNYINTDTILVEGRVTADGKVNIYANGVKIDEVNAVNKVFSKEVTLTEDESVITATSEMDGRETEPSAGKTVIKDKVAPELIITAPADGLITNERVVDIVGTVTDAHFGRLEINGKVVPVVEGAFHSEEIIHEGENIFNVKAYDLAGNIIESSIRVIVRNELPVITDLEPSEDVNLTEGETLTVSFRSEAGGAGYFRVAFPSGISTQSSMIPMEEVEEGYYVGTWTAPDVRASGLIVEVEFTDIAGNKISATADGRVNIGEDEEEGIVDLEPSQDVTLEWGETLTVSFRSGEGGAASFRMAFPGYNVNKSVMVSMREVSPGYYEGTWTAPNNTVVSGILVEVTYTGTDGNTLTATANGRVNVVAPDGGAGNPLKPIKPGQPIKPTLPSNPTNPINPVEPKDIF